MVSAALTYEPPHLLPGIKPLHSQCSQAGVSGHAKGSNVDVRATVQGTPVQPTCIHTEISGKAQARSPGWLRCHTSHRLFGPWSPWGTSGKMTLPGLSPALLKFHMHAVSISASGMTRGARLSLPLVRPAGSMACGPSQQWLLLSSCAHGSSSGCRLPFMSHLSFQPLHGLC